MKATLWTTRTSPHTGRIEFANPRRQDYVFVITATVEADGVEHAVDVETAIEPYRQDMLGFFEDMATHADGWSGVMSWRSEFSAIAIDARNPGNGHVEADVTINPLGDHDEGWHGSLHLNTASLSDAAAAMKQLLGIEHGHRLGAPGAPPPWRPLTS